MAIEGEIYPTYRKRFLKYSASCCFWLFSAHRGNTVAHIQIPANYTKIGNATGVSPWRLTTPQ